MITATLTDSKQIGALAPCKGHFLWPVFMFEINKICNVKMANLKSARGFLVCAFRQFIGIERVILWERYYRYLNEKQLVVFFCKLC